LPAEMKVEIGRFPQQANPERVIADAERIGRAIVEKAGLAERFTPAWRM